MTKKDVKVSRYKNFQTHVEGKKLIIEVDLDPAHVDVKPSKSGKSLTISTTGGIRNIGVGELKLSMTVFMPVPTDDNDDEDIEYDIPF